jgi:hypothetical protein
MGRVGRRCLGVLVVALLVVSGVPSVAQTTAASRGVVRVAATCPPITPMFRGDAYARAGAGFGSTIEQLQAHADANPESASQSGSAGRFRSRSRSSSAAFTDRRDHVLGTVAAMTELPFGGPPFDAKLAPYSGDERAVVSWLLDYHRRVLLRKVDVCPWLRGSADRSRLRRDDGRRPADSLCCV